MKYENDLIDTYGVTDIFCEGLERIDHLGSCRRLVFTVRDGGARSVVAKLIMPAEALADLAQRLAANVHVPDELASLSPDATAN